MPLNNKTDRLICWFSCGAASAIATKLAIADNKGKRPLIVAYTKIKEEHPDNERFLEECQQWFGQKIVILQNKPYKGSIYEVFEQTRFLKGPHGAACSRLLKKDVRKKFELPTDTQVFGYTIEEKHRVERLLDANDIDLWTPLIDKGLTKQDCLVMLSRANIELPVMYRLGYKNNNCIGCVKGEAGYWNKIRVDFPDVFERMSQVEESLGRTVCKIERKGKLSRIPLKHLPTDAGRYKKETDIDCGIFCLAAENEYS